MFGRRNDPNRLFIGKLAAGTNDARLKQAFSAMGVVSDAKVIINRFSGRSRGFGYVTFQTPEGAGKALAEMDGVEIDGNNVLVNRATSRA